MDGDASRIQAEADRWLQVLSSEYSTARLRLMFNIEHNRTAEAIDAIDELQAFLPIHSQSPYCQWLSQARDTLLRRLANSQK